MKGPGENVLRFANVEQCQAHQRRHAQLETAPPLGLQIGVQPALLLAFRQSAPVLLLEMQTDLAMHLLLRFQTCHSEAGPQNRVPFDNAFPRLPKGGDVQFLRQRAEDLFDIDSGVRRGKAVEEHPLLHRRKGVAFVDVVRGRDLFFASHAGWRRYPLRRARLKWVNT